MFRTLCALLAVCLLSGPVVAATCAPSTACTYFWLSPTDNPSHSGLPINALGVPEFSATGPNGTGSVYIWGRPALGMKLKNFSLNLKADTTGSIQFTGSHVYSDSPTVAQDHWEVVGEPVGTSNSILNILGYSLNSGYLGLGPDAKTSSFYNLSKDAWLVARVDYSMTTALTNHQPAKLFLEIGSFGMNYQNTTPPFAILPTTSTNVVFGSADDDFFNAGPSVGGRNTHVGSDWDAQINYLNADFDGNLTVEGTDLTFWRAGYGIDINATHGQGDANGDGDVDGHDFLIWQRQYGMSIGGGLSAVVTVPEPASLGMAVWAVFGMILTTRRRRHRLLYGDKSSISLPATSVQRIRVPLTCVNGRGES